MQVLKIVRKESHCLLRQNKIKELETHLKKFEECLEGQNNLKNETQKLKIEKDESIDNIEE